MVTTGIITDLSIDFATRKSKINLLLDTRDIEPIESILHKFEKWLKQYSLFDLYVEKWKCKG